MNLLPNFQKGELDRTSILRGVAGNEEVCFFRRRGVAIFYIKNNLKSEIFNDKKGLLTKMFFSVITKNSNQEMLTKNIVTFKK